VCPCEGCRGDDRPTNTKSNYIFMCVHVKVVEGMIGPLTLNLITYSYVFFGWDDWQKVHRSNISYSKVSPFFYLEFFFFENNTFWRFSHVYIKTISSLISWSCQGSHHWRLFQWLWLFMMTLNACYKKITMFGFLVSLFTSYCQTSITNQLWPFQWWLFVTNLNKWINNLTTKCPIISFFFLLVNPYEPNVHSISCDWSPS